MTEHISQPRLRKGSKRQQPCAVCGRPFLRHRKAQRACSLKCGSVLSHQALQARLAADADNYLRSQFWRRVEKTGTCWLWHGDIYSGGYGRLSCNGRTYRAHRLAYELMVGPIPDGLVIDHLCRVRNCVRPDHLRVVTQAENVLADNSLSPPRINLDLDHCRRGHPFDEANTYRHGRQRRCRTCSQRKRCSHGHEFTPENTVMQNGRRRCAICLEQSMR